MLTEKRKKHLSWALIAVVFIGLVASVRAYRSTGDNPPPRLELDFTSTNIGLQGLLQNQAHCNFPGYEHPNQAFQPPSANKQTLSAGINIFHSPSDLTVQQVLQRIAPKQGNKILVITYNPLNNPQNKFSIYPPINNPKVISINSPQAYTIPKNNGIIIVSCQPTEIYNIKASTSPGSGLPGNLDQIQNNWVLASASADLNLDEYGVTAVWPQRAAGYSRATFPQFVNPQGELVLNTYYMVWIKITGREQEQEAFAFPAAMNCTTSQVGQIYLEDQTLRTIQFSVSNANSLLSEDFTWSWNFGDNGLPSREPMQLNLEAAQSLRTEITKNPITHNYSRSGTYYPKVKITHLPSMTIKNINCGPLPIAAIPSDGDEAPQPQPQPQPQNPPPVNNNPRYQLDDRNLQNIQDDFDLEKIKTDPLSNIDPDRFIPYQTDLEYRQDFEIENNFADRLDFENRFNFQNL